MPCVYWLNIGQINGRVGIRWEYYPHKRFKNWLPKFVEEPQMTLFFLACELFFFDCNPSSPRKIQIRQGRGQRLHCIPREPQVQILALSNVGRGQDICEAVSAKTGGKYLRYIVPTVFRDSGAKKVLPR